jgi:DNA-binding NarL/FixJ family response regulator
VLAEDSYLMREGIRLLIEEEDDLTLVASCGDLGSLLAAVDEHAPDVVITDIRMPPTNTDEGIRAAQELREPTRRSAWSCCRSTSSPAWALQLLEDGSAGRGYLLKERVGDLDELTRAVRTIADGGSVIDPQVVDALVEARIARERSLLARLTDRELEVLATSPRAATTRASRAPSTSASGRWRSTSTRSSPSSASRPRSRSTAVSAPCSSTSPSRGETRGC